MRSALTVRKGCALAFTEDFDHSTRYEKKKMKKRQSLIYQAKTILTAQFNLGFGRSKHADKQYNANENVIYSRNTYKSALQKACTFLKFCKEQLGVRDLAELREDYFTWFVYSKGYARNTAAAYKWAVTRLQNGYNAANKTAFRWCNDEYRRFSAAKTEKRRQQMPRELHDKLIAEAYEQSYANGLALDLARALGLRVSEITNLRVGDFRFSQSGRLKAVYIHASKGGRNRVIPAACLSAAQISTVCNVCQHFQDKRGNGDRLFENKTNSYTKAFAKARDIVTKEYTQCGVHSLRKEFANDFYNREMLKNSRTAKEIKRELTELLGHSRLDVLRYYIKPN
jgi:integrase